MVLNALDAKRAVDFGSFLDALTAPTPNQTWLEQAAAKLRQERDPDGVKRGNRSAMIVRLTERDGGDCWFCRKPLGQDISIEHLQPLALQGSWADANLALAHKGCNKAAGHLTRFDKERLRDELAEQ
jgi:5-methylcytosine-specific restriction endonuclease McrA